MKKTIILLVMIYAVVNVYSQNTELDNTTNTEKVPIETGRLLLREISTDAFEDPTSWEVIIPFDKGNANTRRQLGGSNDKEELRLEQQINNYNPIDQYVLGVRIEFYGRDFTDIRIYAKNPIYVPGVVKILSVWVVGRNKNHTLSLIIRDMDGKIKKLPFGKLDFNGWEKLEVIIPPDINQVDPSGSLHGLYFIGYLINTDFEDTVGRYYIYFDDMRVISDVMDEALTVQSSDDMGDGW